MKDNRPINLDLASMKFPPMAIASILHRLSGIGLFVLLPYMLYLLQGSLGSSESFEATAALLRSPIQKLILLVFMAALIYHLLAGIRHLVMDMGFGETLESGRRSAVLVIIAAFILTVMAGVWIW